jgi:hypothetical protein
MDGLIQIQVASTGAGWFLVGLDKQGTIWFGRPHGGVAAAEKIAWSQMVEAPIAPRPGAGPLTR